MDKPTLADYAHLISTLFTEFQQTDAPEFQHQNLHTFENKSLILFFMLMQFRRITEFKTQWRWLESHPEMLPFLGFTRCPSRWTLSRRYKQLADVVTSFIAFVAEQVAELDERFQHTHLVEDKSLFKADGPVWHQVDRKAGHVPLKLRRLDTDATWSKSAYHGWVYGYGLHLTCTEAAFPILVQVETAACREGKVLDEKADIILERLCPTCLTADDGYTKAMRIRNWAKQGVVLLTPALRWVKGRFAENYHCFIKQPTNQKRFHLRKTSVEPLFDLIAKVIGAGGYQKQLSVQRLVNVRMALVLATFSVQIAMIMNSIWGLQLRNISTMSAAFS